MAKKPTDAEKAANKEAALLKRAAHSERARELNNAEKEAVQAANASALAQEYKQAEAVAEAARKQRDDEINAIEVQIALLKDKITALQAEYDPRIDQLWAAKRLAGSNFYAERSKMVEAAKSRFQDLADDGARWSSSCWTPPAGYLEQFAATHAAELAEKKTKREKNAAKKTTA